MTTITSRIGGAPAAANTKRVATSGAGSETFPTIGTDTWGGTWRTTWGRTWFFGALAVAASGEAPALSVTGRVSGAGSENITKRITGIS
jgi:hypothetical protein